MKYQEEERTGGKLGRSGIGGNERKREQWRQQRRWRDMMTEMVNAKSGDGDGSNNKAGGNEEGEESGRLRRRKGKVSWNRQKMETIVITERAELNCGEWQPKVRRRGRWRINPEGAGERKGLARLRKRASC